MRRVVRQGRRVEADLGEAANRDRVIGVEKDASGESGISAQRIGEPAQRLFKRRTVQDVGVETHRQTFRQFLVIIHGHGAGLGRITRAGDSRTRPDVVK